MAQKLIQTQQQKAVQTQRLSQQQMLQVRLLSMPIAELEENIRSEIDDNPALEPATAEPFDPATDHQEDGQTDADYEEQTAHEERQDALDAALESIGSDDEMPPAATYNNRQNADYEEIVYGNTTSFYDKLHEQALEVRLTATQSEIMDYLIGSLDDDGLLRKDTETIADEMAIYHNIDVSPQQVDDTLAILQTFDPAGVGARSLQECLLIQIKRKERNTEGNATRHLLQLMKQVITSHFNEFTKNHWDKIQSQLSLDDRQTAVLQNEIRRQLNPKPGSALGETIGRNMQQITPDFLIDTDDEGRITISLNQGNIPQLNISPSFSQMAEAYKNNKQGMNRSEKEALLYAKEKVDKAKGYIEAIRQRQHTMLTTMKAIVDWQQPFFQEGNESDLKPMILKDIADKTGLDISTVSRVSNVKYAQTRWGTFPLRHFFSDSYTTDDGQELSTRKIKVALRELIEQENKRKPMSDDALAAAMKQHGYPIARRTVTKYREQMNIPVARLRKV